MAVAQVETQVRPQPEAASEPARDTCGWESAATWECSMSECRPANKKQSVAKRIYSQCIFISKMLRSGEDIDTPLILHSNYSRRQKLN